MKRLPNEQQCFRKSLYLTESQARGVARKCEDKRGVKLKVYRCPVCLWWHLAKQRKSA